MRGLGCDSLHGGKILILIDAEIVWLKPEMKHLLACRCTSHCRQYPIEAQRLECCQSPRPGPQKPAQRDVHHPDLHSWSGAVDAGQVDIGIYQPRSSLEQGFLIVPLGGIDARPLLSAIGDQPGLAAGAEIACVELIAWEDDALQRDTDCLGCVAGRCKIGAELGYSLTRLQAIEMREGVGRDLLAGRRRESWTAADQMTGVVK